MKTLRFFLTWVFGFFVLLSFDLFMEGIVFEWLEWNGTTKNDWFFALWWGAVAVWFLYGIAMLSKKWSSKRMKRKSTAPPNLSRRDFNKRLLIAGSCLGIGPALLTHRSFAQTSQDLKIGIIGSGRIGGAIGIRWAEAGHQVLFSSRHPDQLTDLIKQAGENASAGFPAEAAAFGDVVFIAVPYHALPQVGEDYAHLMQDKVVIDCGNPRADRDGPMADEAIAKGTGVASAEYLPGVRLVRAFNAISWIEVGEEAFRDGDLIGVPIAGDDAAGVAIASQLVTDIGFDPVIVGGLDRAKEFDRGTDVYVKGLTAAELRTALKL